MIDEIIKNQIKAKVTRQCNFGQQMLSDDSLSDGTLNHYHTKNGIRVYYKNDPVAGTPVVRGDTVCENMQAEEFLDEMLLRKQEQPINPLIHPDVKKSQVLDRWTDKEGEWRVVYYGISPSYLVADRDFIYASRLTRPSRDEIVHCSTSVDEFYQMPEPSDTFQPLPRAVTGHKLFACIHMKQQSNGNLSIRYVNQGLPGGWLPLAIVRQFVYSTPDTLYKTATHLKRRLNIPPPPPTSPLNFTTM